jgi:vacuolar-type H+-ATPase subunit H
MTDDLIKRLSEYDKGKINDARQKAADRIEELEERNKELTLQLLATSGQAADALDRAVVAEAKLAKAMAGLRKIADHKHFFRDQGWTQNAEARIARTALAELEVKE